MSMPKESGDTEQQSYFYVVWPEESKSPGGTTPSTASTAAISSSSYNNNATTVASSPAQATTMPSLGAPQPALSYEVAESRHNSSSSSMQSRSPEESHMQAVRMASLQNKTSTHGSLDEPLKINSNGGVPGIRHVHHAALSPSSTGGLTATTTYVIPSIASASGRHVKSLMAPVDYTPPQKMQYNREPDGDANLREIGEHNNLIAYCPVVISLYTCCHVELMIDCSRSNVRPLSAGTCV